jgi:hypothetical protein
MTDIRLPNENPKNINPIEIDNIIVQDVDINKLENNSPILENTLLPPISQKDFSYLLKTTTNKEKIIEIVLEGENKRRDNLVDIAKLREENRHKEQVSREYNFKFGVGMCVLSLALVLLYSGISKNNTLPEKVINVAVGVLGGAGGATLIKRPDEKNK